jgi:hypothetical protein
MKPVVPSSSQIACMAGVPGDRWITTRASGCSVRTRRRTSSMNGRKSSWEAGEAVVSQGMSSIGGQIGLSRSLSSRRVSLSAARSRSPSGAGALRQHR